MIEAAHIIVEPRLLLPNVIGSAGESARGRSTQANNTATRYMIESYLGYDHAEGFAQFNLTGGASVEWNTEENDFLRGEGFAHTQFQYPGNAADISFRIALFVA